MKKLLTVAAVAAIFTMAFAARHATPANRDVPACWLTGTCPPE